ncbi:MAG: response regulator receiver modulated sensor protein, partial [Bryobacterales bacterium]|nr:response regulator receiver modulated sensor protein [Bryobacterales bacterium]
MGIRSKACFLGQPDCAYPDIKIVADGFILPVPLLLSAVAVLALFAGGWWIRERRLDAQRRSMRVLHALSEDIIAASSPAGIAEILASRLPEATRATSLNLYLFNRRTKALERVPTAADPEPMAAPVDSPPDGLSSAAVVCFRNRTQLNIPDVRRSPLVKVGLKTSLPRAALFMPLIAQNEVLGVLEVHNDRKLGYFKPEEQAAVHHLANQAAASLKLQEQHAIREQLFRSEKLAATGQLISGVASDLRAPLDSILQLAESLASSGAQPSQDAELQRLSAEANRASEIVWRLVSFAHQDQSAPQRVNLSALMAGLTRFREPEWRVLGLRHQSQISQEPAEVAGVESQIEQVCLNLLVYAEQRAVESGAKTIAVKTSVLAGRARIEIDYSSPHGSDAEPDPFAEGAPGAPGLEVCLGILRNHGGDARQRRRPGLSGFEIELPLAPPETAEPAGLSGAAAQRMRPLTLMLVDPDTPAQRALVTSLGSKGHRVVPSSAEGAADIVQRLRFDAILWAARPGGSAWTEFHDRFRAFIPAFVLIGDSYDHELAGSLGPRGGFLLSRPVEDRKLAEILREIA